MSSKHSGCIARLARTSERMHDVIDALIEGRMSHEVGTSAAYAGFTGVLSEQVALHARIGDGRRRAVRVYLLPQEAADEASAA